MKRAAPLLAVCLLLLIAANSGLDRRLAVGIYADEGTQFAIARSLMASEIRYLAVKDSTLLFAKGPVFSLMLAIWWRISGTAGANLDALFLARSLVFLLHGLNLCLLYQIIRRRSANVFLAGTAALLWALFPLARLLNPLAFSYHCATTLVLLSWLFWCHAQKNRCNEDRWRYLAAFSFGGALLTDLVIWTLLPGFLVAFGRVRLRKGAKLWAIMLSPTLSFVLLQLGISAEATQMDLQALGTRISADAITVPWLILRTNLRNLILAAPWFPLCLLGVWVLPRQLRAECFGFVVIPLLWVASTVPITGLAAYHLIPWLPWFALLAAALLVRMAMHTGRKQLTGSWFKVLLMAFVAGLWLFSGPDDSYARVSVSPAEASAMVQFLQDRRKPEELVLASPALAWMLPGKAADFQMALAAEGKPSVHLPRDLPAERFAFDARFAAAQFAVMDDQLFRWALVRMPDLVGHIARIEADWRLVFQTPSLKVYQRASLP
ncbi:MAG: hypothetical protein OXF83_03090 [Anaerolineaceae bacterium]|nr:hypothetical protein [Anaerolineaceae bacterium]